MSGQKKDQPNGRIFYAQSGGVTAVINATAAGVIEAAAAQGVQVLAGRNGILGALREELYETWAATPQQIAALRHRPGGVFGSCRHKLSDPAAQRDEYQRLFEVFAAHDVRWFLYNGGNDSQDTANKVAAFARDSGYRLGCLGVPKTVDNDLCGTDCCPGFGSAAKYVAVSTREAALDVASMAETSTRVFILEVMGRHAGWLAAAGALAARAPGDAPHLLLLPEVPFRQQAFLQRVEQEVQRNGHAVVVASEGVRGEDGALLAEGGARDSFGHAQLGGVAALLAQMTTQAGFKTHWAVADYLQRSARHLASATDLEQAYSVGVTAVRWALEGQSGVMPGIRRLADDPYRWDLVPVPLEEVANREKGLPQEYIREDGWGVTEACLRYLAPLIEGEAPPPYERGLPQLLDPELRLREQQLPAWKGA